MENYGGRLHNEEKAFNHKLLVLSRNMAHVKETAILAYKLKLCFNIDLKFYCAAMKKYQRTECCFASSINKRLKACWLIPSFIKTPPSKPLPSDIFIS